MSYGDFIKSDVIKVPHHGGKLGETEKIKLFFDQVEAGVAVISVGQSNRYGAPYKGTVDIILSSGAKVYETKDCGALKISVDNKGVFEKKEYCKNN